MVRCVADSGNDRVQEFDAEGASCFSSEEPGMERYQSALPVRRTTLTGKRRSVFMCGYKI